MSFLDIKEKEALIESLYQQIVDTQYDAQWNPFRCLANPSQGMLDALGKVIPQDALLNEHLNEFKEAWEHTIHDLT